jgi:hypothetical protein
MAQYKVLVPGAPDLVVDERGLQQLAITKQINGDTQVIEVETGQPFQAKLIPGVFSSKDWLTALLLSFFLGGLGIDAFYLGKTGQGVGKLLTAGGCGVWALIDFILIATRSTKDSTGLPLA